MRKRRVIGVSLFLVLSCALAVHAGGGGGLTYGAHIYVPQYANRDLVASCFGGFGYGSTFSGQRIGGFGLAILDNSNAESIAGGFGGVLVGREVKSGPFMLSLNVWSGLGGAGTSFGDPTGFFGLFLEANIEVGVSIIPWMQLVGYAGMQAVTNLIPGLPFFGTLIYTPVFGTRIAWGSF